MKNILLVEDGLTQLTIIKALLEGQGWSVTTAITGREAIQKARKLLPDIVLLDLGLPDIPGHEVCKAIREAIFGKIIVLTQSDDEVEEILSLELGADDFVVKSGRNQALISRIKYHLDALSKDEPLSRYKADGTPILRFQGLTLNLLTKTACNSEAVQLSISDGEFLILSILSKNAGKTIDRQRLCQLIYGGSIDASMCRAMDSRISRLRRKLNNQGVDGNKAIKTVHGEGYVFALAPV